MPRTPVGARGNLGGAQTRQKQGKLINHLFRSFANQAQGRGFEQVFLYHARSRGLLVIENGQKVRWLPGGKVVVEKCQLDFTVLNEARQVAFLDCKATKGASMAYSAFDPRQVALAESYQAKGFVAGFVVLFRELGLVSFFSAAALAAVGPRRSAKPPDGIQLGPPTAFDLRQVFTSPST